MSPHIFNEIMAGSCEIFGLDQLLLLEHQKFHQTFIFFARLLDFKGLAEKKKLSVRGLDGAMNFIQKNAPLCWLRPLPPSLT